MSHPERKKLPVLKAVWDEEGYNQWGTRYISSIKCPSCGSDCPSNEYGMGMCPQCRISVNPMKS